MAEETLYSISLSRAMALCSGREYAPEDIRSKLQSWGLSENEASNAIKTLITENFLNEHRFAEAFIKDKFNYNKWGKVKIVYNLRMKKIPSEIIKESLKCIDDETYKATAKNLIEAHRKKVKAKNQYDLKGKLIRYGLSKGFEMEMLYEIINIY